MASCIQSIGDTTIGAIPELFPSTITPFSFNSTLNKLFKFDTETNTTISFAVNMYRSGGSIVNSTISIYKINDDSSIDVIGSVNITDTYTVFNRDFQPGVYVLCMRTFIGSYTGNITTSYVNFPITQRMAPKMYHGQTLTVDLIVEEPSVPCDEPIFFEILEGELPPGIHLTLNGFLEGVLPNLDCIEETAELSPSVNWLFVDEDGYKPWGYRWRFKMRAYLANKPYIFHDEWFCIQVHNNWDFDRDNFLAQAPFDRVRTVEIIEQPKKLPENICCEQDPNDPDTVIFVPQKIEPPKCVPCEEENTSQLILVPIPEPLSEKPVSEIAKWYEKYQNTIFDNNELNNFANSLKRTKAWETFLKQRNINGLQTLDDGRNIIVESQNGNLEIAVTSNINATHFDVIMERLRNLQNEKLPMTHQGYTGESLSIVIT